MRLCLRLHLGLCLWGCLCFFASVCLCLCQYLANSLSRFLRSLRQRLGVNHDSIDDDSNNNDDHRDPNNNNDSVNNNDNDNNNNHDNRHPNDDNNDDGDNDNHDNHSIVISFPGTTRRFP